MHTSELFASESMALSSVLQKKRMVKGGILRDQYSSVHRRFPYRMLITSRLGDMIPLSTVHETHVAGPWYGTYKGTELREYEPCRA